MKLRRVQTDPPALLKGRVPGELNIALSAYAAHYRETAGQMIELWPLVVQILEQFLDADRDFPNVAAADPEWARRRTGEGLAEGPGEREREEEGDARAR